MRVILVLVVLVVLAVACESQKETEAIPVNVIPKEKMVSLMVNVHLAEAALNLNYLTDNKVKSSDAYNTIFNTLGVSPEQYEQSLKYYTGQPELMMEIYDEVLNELSKMQASVTENKPSLADSIQLKQKPQRGLKFLQARSRDSLKGANE